MTIKDVHNLQRFLDAQSNIYSQVITELQQGSKRTHWIWFIFPQMAGLGFSQTASYYGIKSIDEARSYLKQPILGERLRECVRLVLNVKGKTARQIFGSPDDLKFCSSMTLFQQASPDNSLFAKALDQYYQGKADTRTLQLLGRG